MISEWPGAACWRRPPFETEATTETAATPGSLAAHRVRRLPPKATRKRACLRSDPLRPAQRQLD